MEFYASLTINRCHLDRLCEIWAGRIGGEDFPFCRAIVSPLFARSGILQRLRRHRTECRVILDSGGFHIQQGRIALESVSKQLGETYLANNWAHRFVMPDAPITSLDSPNTVQRKLRATRRQYQTFPARLPVTIRQRLLPVVHGTTFDQIRQSAASARRVGSATLGFGAFSTSGPNAGVNSFTSHSLGLLVKFSLLCKQWKLGIHAFGIGGSSAVVVLNYIPVASFDSAGWIRTAAYGNVYLPYIGAVNITGAASRRQVTRREFNRLRKTTGHLCPFCRDEDALIRSWSHRALHNYVTVRNLVHELHETPPQRALENLRMFNPRFGSYLETVLAQRNRTSRNSANRENSDGQ